VLWLASTPFIPTGPLVLVVTGRPPLAQPLTPADVLTGQASVRALPEFAGDLS
jgi:hypothetical protein